MKRVIAWVLSLAMVFAVLPVNVLAINENEILQLSVDDLYVIKSNAYYSEENGDVYNIYNLLGYYRPYYVSYTDGSSEPVYGPYSPNEDTWVDLLTTCSVPYEEWEVGNTYDITATLLGVSDTFRVTVLEIESVTVGNVVCIQNHTGSWDGYWDGYGNYVENAWFKYDVYPDNITLDFTDGTSISGDASKIAEYIGYYPNFYSDQSYENQWDIGMYSATFNIAGYANTYAVEVIETPVESILVDDITYLEGTNGWKQYNEDNAQWYYYDINPEELTVVLKDGTVLSGSLNEVCEQLGCWQNCTSDQSYTNQWGVGEHSATIDLLGVTAEYKIIITDSPIQSIEIADIEIIEHTKGWEEGDFFYYCNFYPQYSITLTNGETVSNNGIEIDGVWYSLDIDTSIQYDEPWTAGNTYTVTGSILGVSDTFNVTIIENPIESIEIENVSILEYTNGYYSDGNYYYNSMPALNATVIYKDGTTQNISHYFEINGEAYWISNNAFEMQQEQPWSAGTYVVTGTLMGISDTFEVTIAEAPIKSIEIEDISIIEGSNGYYDGDDFYYSIYDVNYTVTFIDGTVQKVSGNIKINDELYGVSVDASSQNTKPWVAGNTYTATGTLMGVSDTFNVTIVPSPIESLVFEDVVLYEGVDSSEWYEYPYYYIDATLSEVLLKNGETANLENNHLIYEGDYYSVSSNADSLQKEEHWTAGNTYQVTGTLLGVSATFNVTILENPVQKLELVKSPYCIDMLIGGSVNLKGAIIRIWYTDGTYEDVTIEDDYTSAYRRLVYSEKIGRGSALSLDSYFEDTGLQTAKATLFGMEIEIPVNVKANLTESISIREDTDKFIVITVYNSDNTSYDMKLLDVCYMWEAEDGIYEACIFTDKGQFDAIFYSNEVSFAVGLEEFGSNSIVKSNSLPSSDWFDVVKYISDGPWSWNFSEWQEFYSEGFTGSITKENIDMVIHTAGRLEFSYGDYEMNSQHLMIVPGEDVKNAALKYFVVDTIDLTLSEKYDPQADIYLYDPEMGGGMDQKCFPDQINYKNGIWSIKTSSRVSGQMDIIQLKLDDSLRILYLTLNESDAPESPVCSVTPNGEEETVTYQSLEEALSATAGGTIKLLMDATADTILLKPGMTLDLNGHTLTADSVIVFNDATILDGGTACLGGGLLKVAEENLGFMRENGQGVIPVWNGIDGYVFTKVTFQQLAMAAGEGAAQYVFLPTFSNADAADLMADGGTDNGLKIKVSLTWNDGQSQQFYTYSDELVQKVFDGTGRWVFSLTITGIAGIDDMTASAVIVTDSGAQATNIGTAIVAG